MLKKFFALAVIWGAVLAVGARAGDAGNEQPPDEDIVLRTDGKMAPPSNIKSESYIEVTFKKGAPVPSYLVKEIIRANRDANYSTAIEKRDQMKFTLAAFHFQAALAAAPDEPWVKEYCNYGLAEALYQAALNANPEAWKGYKGKSGKEYKAPGHYYREVLKANPKSRFILDVLVKLPVCLAEEGSIAEADTAIADAKKGIEAYKAECGRIAAGYAQLVDRAMSQLAVSDARVTEKKFSLGKDSAANAEKKWGDAKRLCKNFPDLHGEALDGLFLVLLNKAKASKDAGEKADAYNSAKSEAKAIIDAYSATGDLKLIPLLPGCYNVMGEVNMAQGDDYAKAKNDMKSNDAYAEARWAFTHVIAQFFDNEDYVAAAHYNVGYCCQKLKGVEKDAADKAAQHWKVVVNNFPKSRFKSLAEEELRNAGAAVAPEKKDEPAKTEPEKKDDTKKTK
jgi:TolA-binding protein